MDIDISALTAVLFDEAERSAFANAISDDPRRLVSAATVLETTIVVEDRRGPTPGLSQCRRRTRWLRDGGA